MGEIIYIPPIHPTASLHVQLCRQLSENNSHQNPWVSSQVEEAPVGFLTASCLHIPKGFSHSSPVTPCESWQPMQLLKHKRNVSTLILSQVAGRCRISVLPKREEFLWRGPSGPPSFICWMIKPQRKIQARCLKDNCFFPAKHCRSTDGMKPVIYSHQLHHLDSNSINIWCPRVWNIIVTTGSVASIIWIFSKYFSLCHFLCYNVTSQLPCCNCYILGFQPTFPLFLNNYSSQINKLVKVDITPRNKRNKCMVFS